MIQDELDWQSQQLQRQINQLSHKKDSNRRGSPWDQGQQQHVIKIYNRDANNGKVVMSQVALPPDANDLIDLPQAADLTGKYQQLGHTGGSRQNQNRDEPPTQETSVRKKKKKEIIQLPKMKIVVKSTKTISFDGQYDSNDESESD